MQIFSRQMFWNLIICFGEVCLGFFWYPWRLLNIANFDKIMLWQCARYIFLKSETSFEIVGKNHLCMSKIQLRFKENLPCTLWKHDFILIHWYWEDAKDVKKKPCTDFAKIISGNKLNTKRFFLKGTVCPGSSTCAFTFTFRPALASQSIVMDGIKMSKESMWPKRRNLLT